MKYLTSTIITLSVLISGFTLALPALAQAQSVEAPGPSQALFNAPYYSCVRNFYVSPTGNDNNAGTQAAPWLTIHHADSASRVAGDCINVMPGTYAQGALISHGGSAATAT